MFNRCANLLHKSATEKNKSAAMFDRGTKLLCGCAGLLDKCTERVDKCVTLECTVSWQKVMEALKQVTNPRFYGMKAQQDSGRWMWESYSELENWIKDRLRKWLDSLS